MDKGTILIIPADEGVARLLSEYFVSTSHQVLMAHTTEDALSETRRTLPQAIIIDLDAPRVDIVRLCGEIRSTPRTRHIHITLLSPSSRRDDRLQALASGVDEFMTKPVDAEELGLRIRNALRRAEFQNLVDPMTGLPGPSLVEERLRELLRDEDSEWALIRATLRGFRPFVDVYGFLAGDEVMRFAAQLFAQTLNELGTQSDFLGQASGENFVVVTAIDRSELLRRTLSERFADGVRAHYSFREREQGYMLIKSAEGAERRVPLMTLNTQLVTSQQGPFYDIFQLTQMQ
jgi:PleD family two-component response regulator